MHDRAVASQSGAVTEGSADLISRSDVDYVHVADWLKVIIGTVAGLIVGLISDPLKGWINSKLKARKIRNILYTSMADLYGFYAGGSDSALRDAYRIGFIESNLEIFEHYFSTEKNAFFALSEAPFIKTFFYLVRQEWEHRHNRTDIQQNEDIDSIVYCIEGGIKHGSIDGKRFRKLISKGPSWRTIRTVQI